MKHTSDNKLLAETAPKTARQAYGWNMARLKGAKARKRAAKRDLMRLRCEMLRRNREEE